MKWILVVILLVIAGFFSYVAVEYFTVAVGHLPSYFPGYKATLPGHAHAPRGHYHRGGAAAAFIAFVALVIAGVLIVRNVRSDRGPSQPAAAV